MFTDAVLDSSFLNYTHLNIFSGGIRGIVKAANLNKHIDQAKRCVIYF